MSLLPSATTCCSPCENSTSTTTSIADLIEAAVGSRLGLVNVQDHGAVGDGETDDSEAFQSAIDEASTSFKRVYLPGTENGYLIDGSLELPDGIEIFGDGISNTTLIQTGTISASAGTLYANSGAADIQLNNIYIHDLTVYGQSDTLGFSEFYHLISLNGVKNSLIERVKCLGFRGDGIFVGSGIGGTDERHNKNVTIRDCEFDGVDYSNRNGVSIIDGDGVAILNSYFTRCTKSDMPGPIDVEPNGGNTFAVVRTIKVDRCMFKDCGGESGKIVVNLANGLSTMTTKPTGFQFTNNWIEGTGGSGASRAFYIRMFEVSGAALTLSTTTPHAVAISGNEVFDQSSEIYGVRDLRVQKNFFTGLNKNALVVGSISENTQGNVVDPVIEHNLFTSTGGALGATTIGNVSGLKLRRNQYHDIASAQASKFGIVFYGSGVTTTSNGFVEDNTFDGTFNSHIFQTSNTTTDENTFLTGNRTLAGAGITTNVVCNRSISITSSATASNNIRLYSDTGNLVVRDGSDNFADVTALSLRLSDRAFLHSDAADVLGQHNGANAQAFYVYNFKTDSTNYERVGLWYSGGVARLDVEGSGTGTQGTFLSNASSHIFRASGSAPSVTFDANATAGNTRMLLYDVDSGALQRVSVGAADSGGLGFKVLRIPN